MTSVNAKAAYLIAIAIIVAALFQVPLARAATPVGEVSLAIGTSRIIGERGNESVTRGMAVMAGDRIETDRGGHVHVRFVDGAYVSVRPGSRLTIESYVYDPAKPLQNAVRFRLESEYTVETVLEPLSFNAVRWVAGDPQATATVANSRGRLRAEDRDGNPVILFSTAWDLRYAEENSEGVRFSPTPFAE